MLVPEPAATADSLDGLSAPVRDIAAGPVRDIVTTVESVDGTEAREDRGAERTVILASGVLFAEESSTIPPAARRRLARLADEIEASGATGTVQIDGHTDDQGSAEYGLVLSRERARAVRDVLAPLLRETDIDLATEGFGEADPRFPNTTEDGIPIPENRAKNRRVEITFEPGR